MYLQHLLDVKLLLLERARLGLFLVMDVEADPLSGVDAQPFLQHLADPDDAVAVGGVRQPDGKLVALPSHVYHGSVNLSKISQCTIFKKLTGLV